MLVEEVACHAPSSVNVPCTHQLDKTCSQERWDQYDWNLTLQCGNEQQPISLTVGFSESTNSIEEQTTPSVCLLEGIS